MVGILSLLTNWVKTGLNDQTNQNINWSTGQIDQQLENPNKRNS